MKPSLRENLSFAEIYSNTLKQNTPTAYFHDLKFVCLVVDKANWQKNNPSIRKDSISPAYSCLSFGYRKILCSLLVLLDKIRVPTESIKPEMTDIVASGNMRSPFLCFHLSSIGELVFELCSDAANPICQVTSLSVAWATVVASSPYISPAQSSLVQRAPNCNLAII